MISGIQIIIQSSDLEEREKLYVSERFDIDTMAEITPPIRDLISGTYQLTAFGIGLDTGMIDSVVYTDRVMVQTTSAPTDIPSKCRVQGRIQDFKRGGAEYNKGEGLNYDAMQYLLYLNAGWKDKYPGL